MVKLLPQLVRDSSQAEEETSRKSSFAHLTGMTVLIADMATEITKTMVADGSRGAEGEKMELVLSLTSDSL